MSEACGADNVIIAAEQRIGSTTGTDDELQVLRALQKTLERKQ